MLKLHSTYKPDTYYTDISDLPKAAQDIIFNTQPELERSSYTVYEQHAFIRGEVEISWSTHTELKRELERALRETSGNIF